MKVATTNLIAQVYCRFLSQYRRYLDLTNLMPPSIDRDIIRHPKTHTGTPQD